MLTVGLIGVGGYGATHRRALAQLRRSNRFALKAAVIHDPVLLAAPERELRSEGVRIYRTPEEMFSHEQGRMDLVVVATGIPLHKSHTVAALEAGYDVLCEKPVAGTMDEVCAMQNARKRSGKRVCVGFQRIHEPRIQELKRRILANEFGALLRGRSMILWPRTTAYYERNGWAGRLHADGATVYDSPVQNACSHYLFALLYLAGRDGHDCVTPRSVYAEHYRAHAIDSADTQFIRVTTEDDAELSITATHACPLQMDPVCHLEFERALVSWRGTGPVCIEHRENGRRLELLHGVGDSIIELYLDLEAALRDGRAPKTNLDNAAVHSWCVERAFAEYGIADVPSDMIKGEPSAPAIAGIAEAATQTFITGRGFAEVGLSWSSAGLE